MGDTNSQVSQLTKLHYLQMKALILALLIVSTNSNNENLVNSYLDALSAENLELVTHHILNDGIDINKTTRIGVSPLMLAVKAQDADLVKSFIEKGANVNAATTSGITVFMLASRYDDKNIALLLIDNGADINAKTRQGLDAREIAKAQNNKVIMNLLEMFGK